MKNETKKPEKLLFNTQYLSKNDYFFYNTQTYKITELIKKIELEKDQNYKFWSDKPSIRAYSTDTNRERTFYEIDLRGTSIYTKEYFENNYAEYLI